MKEYRYNGGFDMYNFDQEPERRHLVDEAGLNSFLSKIYGYMALAVFVSALSAYLTMTVFASQMMSLMVKYSTIMTDDKSEHVCRVKYNPKSAYVKKDSMLLFHGEHIRYD